MKGKRSAPKRPRFSMSLCHEVMHYILLEQERREQQGLHNTKQVDIVNDWLLEAGQRHGHPPPGQHPLRSAHVDLDSGPKPPGEDSQ